jgi:hypothetical protein
VNSRIRGSSTGPMTLRQDGTLQMEAGMPELVVDFKGRLGHD